MLIIYTAKEDTYSLNVTSPIVVVTLTLVLCGKKKTKEQSEIMYYQQKQSICCLQLSSNLKIIIKAITMMHWKSLTFQPSGYPIGFNLKNHKTSQVEEKPIHFIKKSNGLKYFKYKEYLQL